MRNSAGFKTGVVLAALLGISDVLFIGGLGADEGPPDGVILLGVVLGLLTLGALRPLLNRSTRALAVVVVTRTISALTGLPAFFVDNAPPWAAPSVAVSLALTVIAIVLLTRGRTRALATP